MLELLNKLAWFLSMCFAFVIVVGLLIITREVDDSDAGGFMFFGTLILGFIFKGIVFPKDYILSRLHFFKNQILEGEQTQNSSVNSEDSIQQEMITDEYNIESADITPVDIYEKSDSEPIIENQYSELSITNDAPQEPGFIEQFFAENLIAKIGGIIIFIAVLVFLIGIYAVIGPVAKIVIGFCIGFAIYGAGVFLDGKGYTNESRIVLGVGILVNYLVILSGRYLLGDSDGLIGVGMMFLFLILNTVFAVATALVYQSRHLLIFAFIFAYLNPLLLGESSGEPYTLLGYSMIVTLGAMFMSYTRKDEILFPLSFILASIMFLIAPWSDGAGWVSKLLCINTLGVIALYVSTIFKKQYQNIFEVLIAGVFFLIGIMGILGIAQLSPAQLTLMGVSTLSLMGLCYAYMKKGGYLYSIGTLGTVLTLSPVLISSGMNQENTSLSLIIIFAFMLMNIGIIACKSRDFLSQNLSNIIGGLISGALFLTYMIYLFGNIHFPGILQGFTYFGLAAIYSSLCFFIVGKIGIENMKDNAKDQNVFYTIAAIGISFFTLAIAFVFAEHKEIVSIVWLLEANVLFFLYHKVRSNHVVAGALVLFIIGILKFVDFIDLNLIWGSSFNGEYGMLVTLFVVAISLILNLYFLFPKNNEDSDTEEGVYAIHNFFHVIGMFVLVVSSSQIFNFPSDWVALLYFAVITSLLGYIYSLFNSPSLKLVHLVAYIFLLLVHIILFAEDLGRERMDLFTSTLIAGIYALPFIYEYVKSGKLRNLLLFSAYSFYLFVLSTLYVLHIFDSVFMITLYWGVLAFTFLNHGINKDILKMRTLGLYFLSLTVLKIFFYDLWQPGVDGGVGFLVFLATGILMIILSTMYTKKYGNNLNKEFNISNIFPANNRESHNSYAPQANRDFPEQESSTIQEPKAKSKIQKDIESIDISKIGSVKLHFHKEEKATTLRAESLLKISKLIVNTYKKTDFKPGELQKAYDMIESNYKSDLSPAQYKKIRDLIKKFVEQGGSIELVKK